MSWKAVAHSSIGVLHVQNRMPCQDYANYRQLEHGVIIGAVADGAGSAKHSDVGARLAVETTLQYFSKMGAFIQARKRCWESFAQPFSVQEAQRRFAKLVQQRLMVRLEQEAERSGYSVQELACTLLCFIATPYWTAAMQIGDGFLVVRAQGQDYQLLFSPDKGEFANETTFVTSRNALDDMQVSVISHPLEFICAATDGLERVALRVSDWMPFAPFFNPLSEYLAQTPNPDEDKAYLASFLDSERLNQKTQDDKTLLLCLYQNG
jgi:serine/threonine protein phosphatase PrpC